jgi:integrase
MQIRVVNAQPWDVQTDVLAIPMPKDGDPDDSMIELDRRLEGALGDYRTVGIDPRSCELLDRWLDRRAELGLNGRVPIFATYSKGQHGGSLSPVYVRRTLANLGKKANIEKRVHPHGLRHSLAFDLAR